MQMCRWFLIVLCLNLSLFAERNYRVFELGFNPESKTKLLQDMLNSDGKLVTIRPGTVFVRDSQEVLDAIEQLLKDPQLDRVDQVRVSLRRKDQTQKKDSGHSVGIEVGPDGWGIQGSINNSEQNKLQNVGQNILLIVGESAYISLSTTSTQLQRWHRFFLQTVEVQEEVEALQVAVEKSGAHYRVKVNSVYRAKVEGKWQTYETGEIKTIVEVPKGRWQGLGGNTSGGSTKDQALWGLSQQNQETSRVQDLEIRVDSVDLK